MKTLFRIINILMVLTLNDNKDAYPQQIGVLAAKTVPQGSLQGIYRQPANYFNLAFLVAGLVPTRSAFFRSGSRSGRRKMIA